MPAQKAQPDTHDTRRINTTASDSATQCSEFTFFLLLVHFAFLWSAFVLFFDYVIYIGDTLKQFRSFSFVAIEGKVLKCGVKVEEDSDGYFNSKTDIEYGYRVDNQDFKCCRVRYL